MNLDEHKKNISQDDNHLLVEEFRGGSEKAFNELFIKFQKPLYYFAMRLLTNHSDADEVVQRSFIQAYTNIKSFRGECSFKTWIYKITMNQCKDYIKSKDHQIKKVELDNPSLKKLSVKMEHPLSNLMQDEHKRILMTKINLLSDQQRTTVMLRIFEDLSFKEISEILGCTESTAKVHFHQAILKLRGLFGDTEKGDLL